MYIALAMTHFDKAKSNFANVGEALDGISQQFVRQTFSCEAGETTIEE